MDSRLCDKRIIIKLLNKLQKNIRDGELSAKLNEFEFAIIDYLSESLALREWTPQHILAIASGFVIRHMLIEKQRKLISDPLRPGEMFFQTKAITVADMAELKKEVILFYSEQLVFLKSKIKVKEITKLAAPIVWLEMLEKYNIVKIKLQGGCTKTGMIQTLAMQIRCHHYNLQPGLAQNGRQRETFEVYNSKQMIELLSSHFRRSFSIENVIEYCIKHSIGAYIKTESYNLKQSAITKPPSVSEAIDAINDKSIDPCYLYSYEGLGKLITITDHPWYKKATLKHLLCGGMIKALHPNRRVEKNEKGILPYIPLQPSYSEYVLGQTKIIQPHHDKAEILIDLNTLVFIKNEVDTCLNKDRTAKIPEDCNVKTDNAPQPAFHGSWVDQPLERGAIIANYSRLTKSAWEKIFQREKDNDFVKAKIPGKSPYQYSRKMVEQWLITKAHYSIDELNSNEIKKKSRKPNNFSDIADMACGE